MQCVWNVSNFQINSVSCPSTPKFSFLPNKGASGQIVNCTTQVTADWKVARTTFPPLSCSGRATGALSRLAVRVDAGPVVNQDKTLKVKIYDIVMHVDDLDLAFKHGSCSLWTSILRQLIQNEIKYTLNNKFGDIFEVHLRTSDLISLRFGSFLI